MRKKIFVAFIKFVGSFNCKIKKQNHFPMYCNESTNEEIRKTIMKINASYYVFTSAVMSESHFVVVFGCDKEIDSGCQIAPTYLEQDIVDHFLPQDDQLHWM